MGHPSVTLGLKCGPEMGAPICTEPIGHKFNQLQRAKSLSVTGNFSCAFLERRFLNCADMLALIIDLYGFPWVYTGAVHSGFCCVLLGSAGSTGTYHKTGSRSHRHDQHDGCSHCHWLHLALAVATVLHRSCRCLHFAACIWMAIP